MEFPAENIIKNDIVSYLNNRTFTGCSVGFFCLDEKERSRHVFHVGKKGRKKNDSEVDSNTFFDVASLTKPLVTLLAVLYLLKAKKVNLDDDLQKLLAEEKIAPDKQGIRLSHLLSHTSGLPSHRPFFNNLRKIKGLLSQKALLKLILREKLENAPGAKYIYSDLDYMLLGIVIERICKKNIAQLWREKITDPVGISEKFYFYNDKEQFKSNDFVETGKCFWSGRNLKGIVHDDNCRALGRIAGHAGLFSTLDGIMDLCEIIADVESGKAKHPAIQREDLLLLTSKKEMENWAWGFDVVSGNNPSSGYYFSERTIGHLGFTGTSFWIDLEKGVVVVMLTNRVIYGEDTKKIKEMRPLIHNQIMKAMGKI